MADPPPTPTNECGECGHELASQEPKKGHAKRGAALICKECGSVCSVDVPQPAPATPPPAVEPRAPENVEELADALAKKMGKIRNEMLWHDLHSPGVILQAVDGGYIISSRFGAIAVRVTLDEALDQVRKYMAPP